MKTFALIAYLLVNGEVHTEVIEHGLPDRESCEVLQQLMPVWMEFATEADVTPLACEEEWEA